LTLAKSTPSSSRPRRRSIGLGALGRAVSEMRAVPWLATTPITYWGDLDVEGFQILSALRAAFPHTRSLLNCNIWLLTEVNPKNGDPNGKMAGFYSHLSSSVMSRNQHWAGILSLQPLTPLADPHPASAAATIDGIIYCSSVLPWSTCGKKPPWVGKSLAEKTANTLSTLEAALPRQKLVWGGDWNQNLKGGFENVGSSDGRNQLIATIVRWQMQIPTAPLLHQLGICHTIDHIAVPSEWNVKSARRILAKGLSDRDAYVIEVEQP
jgi:Uncharacterized protein conserved in bacteria C-term(DUF2220)